MFPGVNERERGEKKGIQESVSNLRQWSGKCRVLGEILEAKVSPEVEVAEFMDAYFWLTYILVEYSR